MLLCMDERIEIRLTVERGAGPLRGEIGAPGADGEAFRGWLALLSALQLRLADGERDGATT